MRRFLAHGLVAVAAGIGFAGLAVAADPPATDTPPESRSLVSRLNPFAAKPAEPGPRVRPAVGPLSAETMVAVLQAERDAYTRRLDVCHRLREIALQTNDEQLEAKAGELEKLAIETYKLRVGRLGVKSGGAPVVPTDTLDRTLGTGVAVNPLTTGKPTASAKTATAKANTFKEVNP